MNTRQRTHLGTRLGWLVALMALGWTSVAVGQNFSWPPSRKPAQTPPARSEAARKSFDLPAEGPMARPLQVPAAPVTAAIPMAPASGGRLDWRVLENPNGPHVALIFDPVRQVFAVYHVDSAAGQIMLKSVRNLSADLQLDQFNSSNPAPKDIQSMLDEAR